MANWWQYLGNKAINKLLLPTINKSLSVASSLGFKPTPKQVSPVLPATETKNNTKEVKATTLSTPTYNPEANVINKNALANIQNPTSITGNETTLINPITPQTTPPEIKPPETTPPVTPPATPPVESEADKYFKLYQQSLKMTPEEEALQTQLSNITTGADLGVAGLEGQGRGIPLSLVRGQQEKLLKQAAIQAQPLQKQLELLQARRQAEAEMAKAASDYYGTETYKPTTVGAGETLIDPATGKVIYQGAPKASDFKSVGAGETLIDPITGKVIYQGTPKTDYSNLKEVQGGLYNMATGEWVVQPKATGVSTAGIKAVQGGLYNVNTGQWVLPPATTQNTYGAKVAETALGVIDDITPQVNNYTVGPIGKAASNIPGTPAYNFKSALETLKSNIAFGALTEMRAASKTGGALGQVSDREGALLQSSLGALDIGQSPTQFKAQLKKIKDSITRWNSAVLSNQQQQAADTLSDDEAWNLYQETINQ